VLNRGKGLVGDIGVVHAGDAIAASLSQISRHGGQHTRRRETRRMMAVTATRAA
jgi:hypothetical protein